MSRDLTPRLFIGHFGIWLEFKAADCWLGVYSERWYEAGYRWFGAWICIVPMFPVHITLRLWKVKSAWL